MTNNTQMTVTELITDKTSVPGEFNKVARKYDLATFFSQGYQSDLQRSVDRLGLKGDELVADLCCGTGKSTICCLNNLPSGKVIGVDNSVEMLNIAVNKYSAEHNVNKLEFKLQDVMNLDFPNDSIDAIFMAYGIRNMPDYKKCLTNLYRVLKPGGKICFHEYSLKKNILSRLYWRTLGYLLIIPFSSIITGNVKIFRYLIKSVLDFPSPPKFILLLTEVGFENPKRFQQKSWRRPILHTVIASKPKG